jgi:hypothetical protein
MGVFILCRIIIFFFFCGEVEGFEHRIYHTLPHANYNHYTDVVDKKGHNWHNSTRCLD